MEKRRMISIVDAHATIETATCLVTGLVGLLKIAPLFWNLVLVSSACCCLTGWLEVVVSLVDGMA